jgi:hypothetical protein
MPYQNADCAKQPGETLRYSMTFTPGRAIAIGDTLTGTPTIVVTRIIDGVDVTGDYSMDQSPSASISPSPSPSPGAESEEGMVEPGSVERISNTIYVAIQGGESGKDYKITFKCDTTGGEKDVEEDLILPVREY